MKKSIVKLLGGLLTLALISVFYSCSNGSSDDNGNTDPDTPQTITFEETTSILGGIQSGSDVWGSGTSTTLNADGTYTVVAAGANEGTWGGNIAAIPVCFGAGDLTGYTYIVFEADLSNFNLNDDDATYPAIELKVANDNDSKTKVINATSLYNGGKAIVPLSTVDFLDEATKIQFAVRGTGSLILNDISKAK